MYNKTTVQGNLGKDAGLKRLESGRVVCNFSLATTETWTDRDGEKQEKTTWFDCSIWGTRAEGLHTYLTKGKQVLVEGTVTARAYLDASGQAAAGLQLTVRELHFTGGKPSDESAARRQDTRSQPVPLPTEEPEVATVEADEDLPF